MSTPNKPSCDWNGEPIPDNEPPDAIINVWEIEPTTGLHMDDDCDADTVVERDYHRASELAETVLFALMDECEEGQERTVTVRLTKMKRTDYYEIVDCPHASTHRDASGAIVCDACGEEIARG